VRGVEHRLLFVHAPELPDAQRGEAGHDRDGQDPADQCCAAAVHARSAVSPARNHGDCDNVRAPPPDAAMNDSLKTLIIIGVLILILWNLGAGLYYMLVDKGQTKRTVNALTRRIALSVALILFIALSIYMGWITPHGITG
jgi:hypothetical protein